MTCCQLSGKCQESGQRTTAKYVNLIKVVVPHHTGKYTITQVHTVHSQNFEILKNRKHQMLILGHAPICKK